MKIYAISCEILWRVWFLTLVLVHVFVFKLTGFIAADVFLAIEWIQPI